MKNMVINTYVHIVEVNIQKMEFVLMFGENMVRGKTIILILDIKTKQGLCGIKDRRKKQMNLLRSLLKHIKNM
jgi:hypothetical protein